MNDVTKKIINGLPEWMEIRKNENSIGAQFLDVFGVQFAEVENYLTEQLNTNYISTASLSDLDWIYKTVGIPVKDTDTISVTGDGNILIEYTKIIDFYGSSNTNGYIIDYTSKTIYYRSQYNTISLSVNGIILSITQEIHHIWNVFDEFGLLLGVKRLYQETNVAMKTRILDVFKRPGNTSYSGIKNAIARELAISPSHVQLNTLNKNEDFASSLLAEDGTPTKRFVNIVKDLNTRATVIWEHAVWDNTYWQLLDENLIGLDYMPRIWALEKSDIVASKYQSGIGDGEDCKITILEAQDDVQEFNYYLTVYGTQEEELIVYPPRIFDYEIYAEGYVPKDSSVPEEYYYTVEAAEIMDLAVDITAHSDENRTNLDEFESTGSYTKTNVEVVPSNRIQNNKERYLQLIVEMESPGGLTTPSLSEIGYTYTDSLGAPQTVSLTTLTDFTVGEPGLDPTFNNMTATSGGTLELFKGEFKRIIGVKAGATQDELDSSVTWADIEESSNFVTIGNSIRLKGL